MARDIVMYYSRIRKAGNSLALIIPRVVMKQVDLRIGDDLALVIDSKAPHDLYYVRIFFKKPETVLYEETIVTTVKIRDVGKSVGINTPKVLQNMLSLRKGSNVVFVVDMVARKKGDPIRFYLRRFAEDED